MKEKRDIVVVGASAGGVLALMAFVGSLPKDFPGAVFIVLHIPAYSESNLPAILNQQNTLPCRHPYDGEKYEGGNIYIAPNDHHLLIEGDRVVVKKGPKENRHRPSIDALFRSAAFAHGPRVTGIVLSGMLNDGTSGLWSIKRMGGLAVIQDPEDAEQPDMPKNVLEYVDVDHVVAASEMGKLLTGLVKKTAPEKFTISETETRMLNLEVVIAGKDNAFEMGIMEFGQLTPFTCPECHGSLIRLVEGKIIRFRCHTGHAYTASSLLAEVTDAIESKLWQVLRAMEEASMLLKGIGDHFEGMENKSAGALFHQKGRNASDRAHAIHKLIFDEEQFSEDLRFSKKPD